MRALGVLILFAVTGAAPHDTPDAIGLASEATTVLDGTLSLRLLEGMTFEPSSNKAVFEWGTAHFTMIASDADALDHLSAAAVLDDATARGIDRARIEALGLAKPLTGWAAIPPPPKASDPDLVYLAYVGRADGLQVVAFYVDAGGRGDAEAWAAVAARMAATIAIGSVVSLRRDVAIGMTTMTVPRSAQLRARQGSYALLQGGATCSVRNEQDAVPRLHAGMPDVTAVAATVLGKKVSWLEFWTLDASVATGYTELLTPAVGGGSLLVDCSGRLPRDFTRIRAIIGTLRRTP